MENTQDFTAALFKAVDEKIQWYDSQELPKLLDEYRNYHSIIRNITTTLIKKGAIQEDPYKHDKKITDVIIPDESPFSDSDRALVLGTRLSEYESILDFLCNYFKFSVYNLTVDRIKKLVQLNNYFQWNSMVATSPKQNTRALAECFNSIRMGSEQLSISMLNDSITYANKSLIKINSILKGLTEFQKEVYKVEVRKNIFEHPEFSKEKNSGSPESILQQMKKHFAAIMGKKPFYTELIEEIIKEDYAVDKEYRQKTLLAKFAIQQTSTEKKQVEVNTKDLIMEAVRSLGGVSTQLDQIIPKIDENQKLLESEHNSMWDKFCLLLRKAFNLPERSVEYKIQVFEPQTQTKHSEVIEYHKFVESLLKRDKTYASISVKKSPGYMKIESMTESAILEYVSTQLFECNKMMLLLSAVDDFFKTATRPENRSKVKGIKMELTAIKNTLVKTNQRKAEYTAIRDEQEQMKKLGISNV